MEIKLDFGKREMDTCVNSSGVNAMFDIPYTKAAAQILYNFIEIAFRQ